MATCTKLKNDAILVFLRLISDNKMKKSFTASIPQTLKGIENFKTWLCLVSSLYANFYTQLVDIKYASEKPWSTSFTWSFVLLIANPDSCYKRPKNLFGQGRFSSWHHFEFGLIFDCHILWGPTWVQGLSFSHDAFHGNCEIHIENIEHTTEVLKGTLKF